MKFPTESVAPAGSQPTKILMPDVFSHCPFPLRDNRHEKQATAESLRWLFRGDPKSLTRKDAFIGLKAGPLTAMCYPKSAFPQLRVCCDFMNWLFHLDDLSDVMTDRGTVHTSIDIMNALYFPDTYTPVSNCGRLTRDWWRRCVVTGHPGMIQRFQESMDLFFHSVTLQAHDRVRGIVPDIDSYIGIRRDTSGCKPALALIEYCYNLNIPDEVMEHPIIWSLQQATNDMVTWSNDIFSYNVEQARGDTHNLVVVVMRQHNLDVQAAINMIGKMCKQATERFVNDRKQLPSWGPEIDRQVSLYCDGLQDWIVGTLNWSFETERYFGKGGQEMKEKRVVTLLPVRKVELCDDL